MMIDYRSAWGRRVRRAYPSERDLWAAAWFFYRLKKWQGVAKPFVEAASDPWAALEEVTRP